MIDKQNKVVAIGNPFQNPQIQELYLSILRGDSRKEKPDQITEVFIEQSSVDLGEFDWTIAQKINFTLRNQGKKLLIINDVVASCGCISLDYSKKPIKPGEDVSIVVTYKAEKPEYFNKNLLVYANTQSPIQLTVKGSAKLNKEKE